MKKIREIIPNIIIFLITFTLILMSNTCPFGKIGTFWDAAVYLNVSKRLTEGQVLYKDIIDNKGPVLYFINYVALKLGGTTLVCIFEFIFIYISILYMYKSLQLINNNKLKSLIVVFIAFICYARFFTYGLTCESYALTFSMIAMYNCLLFYKNGKFTKLQCVLIGSLFALCFFIRPNLITVFVGFGLGISIKLIIEKRIAEFFKYILNAFIGFAIICILVFGYLLINNCTQDFIENVFLFNTNMNRLGIAKSIILMQNLMPISWCIICIYTAISLKNITNKNGEYIGIFCLEIVTILFNSISAKMYYHYLISFLPIIILAYNFVVEIIISNKKKTGYIIVLTFLLIYICIQYKSIFIFEKHQPNQNIIKYIQENTRTIDKIAVMGFSDEIYYLSNRSPASKITYILNNNAFEENTEKEMIEQYITDIEKNKPKIIIEDEKVINEAVSKCKNINKYEELKTTEYEYIGIYDNKKIYRFNENEEGKTNE